MDTMALRSDGGQDMTDLRELIDRLNKVGAVGDKSESDPWVEAIRQAEQRIIIMAKTKSGRILLTPGTPEELQEGVPKKDLLSLCMAAGIKHVTILFDGSGDSGQIEGVIAYNVRDIPYPHRDWGGHEKIKKEHELMYISPALKIGLEEVGYNLLSSYCPGDWVNNDGGYGSIEITIDHDTKVMLDYYQRISDVEEHNIDISAEHPEWMHKLTEELE